MTHLVKRRQGKRWRCNLSIPITDLGSLYYPLLVRLWYNQERDMPGENFGGIDELQKEDCNSKHLVAVYSGS